MSIKDVKANLVYSMYLEFLKMVEDLKKSLLGMIKEDIYFMMILSKIEDLILIHLMEIIMTIKVEKMIIRNYLLAPMIQ